MTDETTDVLVVGAGLAGLSATTFLARRGVRVRLVERHPGTSLHPKAAGQNPRTMELLRMGGVADEVARAGDIRGATGDFTIRIVETVGGPVLHSFAESVADMVAATAPCTAEGWGFASQDAVEPILLEAARKFGAVVEYGTEMVDFHQDGQGVEAVLRRADGATDRVRARYLVAADGPESAVRERLGIPRTGYGTLSHFVGMIFEADLSDVLPPGSTGWYYIQNPAFTGNFGPTDKPNRHTFFVEYAPDRGESPDDFTPQRCVELIRTAVDRPGLEPALLDVQRWGMAALVAERWREGRVFLAGDAAKVTPPTGGLGGNTAVGDGYDIAWKLAAVLDGTAGDGLLDSYEAERRAVAHLVVDESYAVYVQRMAPHLAGTAPAGVGYNEVILGFRCLSGAVLPEPDDDGARVEDPLRPSGRAGFRAPHVWITRSGARASSLELFGDGWVLIAGDEAWRGTGEPVTVHVVGADLLDPEGALRDRYGIGAAGAALVRPDGILAWRTSAPYDPATLGGVLDRLLSR
ncbi:aklavinone 12-hydroxylase RdmE [Micromonospora aurantiaca]|uniref:aklavinone 12-hydroxylase RdmE n=1 Tax=Micromonospora aurantiaca (nom. illeg.) TaxID=47850 RepID=UPI0037928506